MAFDIDGFLDNLDKDKSKSRDKSAQLNRVLMNVKTNQGLLTMLPVMSKSVDNFYKKLPRVYEYYGTTSKLDSGEAWFKILSLEDYGDIPQSQKDLWSEVRGYLDTLQEKEAGFVENYGQFRVRNYALFTGIMMSLKDLDGNMQEEYVNCPCLFTYPTNGVIDAFGTAINTKIDVMKGRRDWIPYVLNPNAKGYKGTMNIDFRKSSGVGYDSTITFEFNSDMNMVVDPDYEVPEEMLKYFDDIMPTFLGWCYDRENKSYFNEEIFKELRDQLKIRVGYLKLGESSETAEESYENKNNLNESNDSEAPKKISPFG
jgi:hypothetical protein